MPWGWFGWTISLALMTFCRFCKLCTAHLSSDPTSSQSTSSFPTTTSQSISSFPNLASKRSCSCFSFYLSQKKVMKKKWMQSKHVPRISADNPWSRVNGLCLVKVYIRKKNMMGGTPLFKKNILYVFNIKYKSNYWRSYFSWGTICEFPPLTLLATNMAHGTTQKKSQISNFSCERCHI